MSAVSANKIKIKKSKTRGGSTEGTGESPENESKGGDFGHLRRKRAISRRRRSSWKLGFLGPLLLGIFLPSGSISDWGSRCKAGQNW